MYNSLQNKIDYIQIKLKINIRPMRVNADNKKCNKERRYVYVILTKQFVTTTTIAEYVSHDHNDYYFILLLLLLTTV